MDVEFERFIDEVKDKVSIDEIIEETGGEWGLGSLRGAYRRGSRHDSLVVNVNRQFYVWNDNSEQGDVFNWLKNHRNMEFMDALQFLAEKLHLQLPKTHWGQEETDTQASVRSMEDTWSIAAQVMCGWLWKDEEVLAYCRGRGWKDGTPDYERGRGWSDETIREAQIGFSGRAKSNEFAEMRAALSAAGIDLESPVAVAILGYSGNVSVWSKKWNLTPADNWLDNNYISGMMSKTRLVYAHIEHGRVRYLSGRNILGAENFEDDGKRRVVKSWNPPELLVGKRQPYHNQVYQRKGSRCVVVEGQGDAVALGEMGCPAVATMGTNWMDMVVMLRELKERHGELYLGVHGDDAGLKMLQGDKRKPWPLSTVLGPMTRVIFWPVKDPNSKDANDWLREIKSQTEKAISKGIKLDLRPESANGNEKGRKEDPQVTEIKTDQRTEIQDELKSELDRVLSAAQPIVLLMAKWAGGMGGADHDQAEQMACELICQMDGITYTQYKSQIAGQLRRSMRELDGLIKQVKELSKKKEKELGEPVETIGGWFGEHLVEMMFDPETEETSLAVRFPDGKVEQTDHLVVDGIRYIPLAPVPLIQRGMVRFPSKILPVRSTRELVTLVRMYIHRYLEIDMFYERLASYYVLFSWLYDCFTMVPYLRALGDYGTGKTRFIETIGGLCYRPISTAGVASTASIFRMLELFRGTLILDEADYSQSDETVEIIKILNVGNKKGGNVVRAMDIGNGNIQPVPYSVFGPKIIATRKKFGDEATESRCLTKEMGSGLVREDVPIVEPKEFNSQSLELRNLLLAYRLRYWKPELEINYNQADRSIEPRLNQVTLPLKTIVGPDEPELLEEIDGFIRRYNNQIMVERSMRPEAKVLEAIVELGKLIQPGLDGKIILALKTIADKTNAIIDRENTEDGEAGGTGKRITPKGVGSYIRNKLQLSTERKNSGYYLIWDQSRIEALQRRYGLD